MKTLVYVGAHVGVGLSKYVEDHDRVYAFEPDPVTFMSLAERFGSVSGVRLINAACSDKDGEATFYLFNSRQSSSLSDANPSYAARTHDKTIVKTINLYDFLVSEGVEYIDTYVSDVQGADLSVLRTIEPFVRGRKIGIMEIETHWDGPRIYEDFDNSISAFRKFMIPEYTPQHVWLGGPARHEFSFIGAFDENSEIEWDTVWIPSA